MRERESAAARFKNFKEAPPREVVLPPQEELVSSGFLEGEKRLPLVVTPSFDDVDLPSWAADNGAAIERWLLEHGALLFRGFNVRTAAHFEAFAGALCPDLFAEYEDLPHEKEGKIYRSTPYPADKAILFHNESSHLHRWPRKQWFYCVKAAAERGETPIVDCREMYRRLAPEIRDAFETKGLLYVRNFIPGFDVRWQDFFKTEERPAVEESCRRSASECEWLEGDRLRTRRRSPAVIRHPMSGEKVFFNQVQLHHASCLQPEVRESLLAMYGEEGLPRHVYFGDGSAIPDEVMERIDELYRELAVQYRWREGDVLMVDNMLVAHARNPYVGERKILVAMGELFSQRQLG